MPAAGRGWFAAGRCEHRVPCNPSFLTSALVTQATILFKTPLGLRAGERRAGPLPARPGTLALHGRAGEVEAPPTGPRHSGKSMTSSKASTIFACRFVELRWASLSFDVQGRATSDTTRTPQRPRLVRPRPLRTASNRFERRRRRPNRTRASLRLRQCSPVFDRLTRESSSTEFDRVRHCGAREPNNRVALQGSSAFVSVRLARRDANRARKPRS